MADGKEGGCERMLCVRRVLSILCASALLLPGSLFELASVPGATSGRERQTMPERSAQVDRFSFASCCTKKIGELYGVIQAQ